MNRKLAVALAAVFGLAMTMGSDDTWSQGRGGGQSGGGGGYSRGAGGHGGHAGSGGHYRGSGGHGGQHYGGRHYGGRHGGHYGGHYGGYYGGYYGAGIYLGSSLLWGWPWYGGYGYYPYYANYPYGGYAAYDPAPVVYVESDRPASPPAEAAPAPQNFWYYCTDPAGYYPYVKNCTVPWMQVVPTTPPAGAGK